MKKNNYQRKDNSIKFEKKFNLITMSPKLFNYKTDTQLQNDLEINGEKIKNQFNERYEFIESSIILLDQLTNIAIERQSEEYKILFNAYGFLNLLALDLASAGYYLYFEQRPWQKVYQARLVALLIYEGLMDIPEVLGKYFKNIIPDNENGKQFVKQLKEYNKELITLRDKHSSYLSKIRNNTSGHRDHSIHVQLDVIKNIDPYTMIDLMISFDSILRKLIDHIAPIIVKSIKPNDLKNNLKHLIKNKE